MSSRCGVRPGPIKGRGTGLRLEGRFDQESREPIDDGWRDADEIPQALPETVLLPERARSILSRNQSPDIPFETSINPYRGCEHGCIYCYARPSHAYVDLSPGIDFETRLFYKQDAATILERELGKPGYRPSVISLGSNTDPYQPVERSQRVTRDILEVLWQSRHPVSIVTKGAALIERDLDLLSEMAAQRLVSVAISLTTLDPALKRILEPRAASPQARLRAMRRLTDAGVPVMVVASPMIPAINDAELEAMLDAGAQAGAIAASFIPLRLPFEVKDLFRDWLQQHFPDRAVHVMSIVNQMRGGRDNDPNFGTRMRGQGPFADLLAQRFKLACRRFGLNGSERVRLQLDLSQFRAPSPGGQLGLF